MAEAHDTRLLGCNYSLRYFFSISEKKTDRGRLKYLHIASSVLMDIFCLPLSILAM
jgi:hypothetical protein